MMGGGRTAEGSAIYKRVNGVYIRIAPYKRNNDVIFDVINQTVIEQILNDTNSEITKARNFGELKKALQKDFNISITPELQRRGNFELIQSGMKAVDRMTKLFPQLKNSELVLQLHRMDGNKVCGMDYYGNLYFYEPYFSKNAPKSLENEGSYHPKNFSYEQAVAHELGHKLEALYLKKKYPNGTERQLKASYNLHDGYIHIAKLMYQKLLNAGYRGHAKDMMRAISGYASKNWSEFGAEAIGDVYSNGNSASPVSILFVQTLLEEFNKP